MMNMPTKDQIKNAHILSYMDSEVTVSTLGDVAFTEGFIKGTEWMEQQLEPMITEMGMATLKSGWISVKERLPKNDQEYYFVCVRNKNKEGGIALFDVAFFDDGIFSKTDTWEDVTHWKETGNPFK